MASAPADKRCQAPIFELAPGSRRHYLWPHFGAKIVTIPVSPEGVFPRKKPHRKTVAPEAPVGGFLPGRQKKKPQKAPEKQRKENRG